jgi:hypothetical protein
MAQGLHILRVGGIGRSPDREKIMLKPFTIEQFLNYYITGLNSNASVRKVYKGYEFFINGEKVGMAYWFDRKPSKNLRDYMLSAYRFATGTDRRAGLHRFRHVQS